MANKKHNYAFRFLVLFIVYALLIIFCFSIISANNMLSKGTPRIIALCTLIIVTIIYWLIFLIIYRRERQKEGK